jgi:hypothetical protein
MKDEGGGIGDEGGGIILGNRMNRLQIGMKKPDQDEG